MIIAGDSAVSPGNNFILGISDQALLTANRENIKLVAKRVANHSQYPIKLPPKVACE